MTEPTILINPVVRWAVHPGDQGRIAYVEGLTPGTLPHEDEVITRPFLVDPVTRQPVPVRVTQILRMWDQAERRHVLAVVVSRDQ